MSPSYSAVIACLQKRVPNTRRAAPRHYQREAYAVMLAVTASCSLALASFATRSMDGVAGVAAFTVAFIAGMLFFVVIGVQSSPGYQYRHDPFCWGDLLANRLALLFTPGPMITTQHAWRIVDACEKYPELEAVCIQWVAANPQHLLTENDWRWLDWAQSRLRLAQEREACA